MGMTVWETVDVEKYSCVQVRSAHGFRYFESKKRFIASIGGKTLLESDNVDGTFTECKEYKEVPFVI